MRRPDTIPSRLACLAAAALLPTTALPAQQAEPPAQLLRYRFAKDSAAHYLVRYENELKGDTGGQPTAVSAGSQTWFHWRVVDVDDGTARLQCRIDRVKMRLQSARGTVEVDTADADSVPEGLAAMLAIVGQPASARVDGRGKTSESTSPARPAGPLPASGPGPDRILKELLVELPEHAVTVGDTWLSSTSETIVPLGDVAIDVRSELISLKDGKATIRQTMTVDVASDDASLDVQTFERRVVLDAQTGMLLSLTQTKALKAEAQRGGRRMRMETRSKATIERVEAGGGGGGAGTGSGYGRGAGGRSRSRGGTGTGGRGRDRDRDRNRGGIGSGVGARGRNRERRVETVARRSRTGSCDRHGSVHAWSRVKRVARGAPRVHI